MKKQLILALCAAAVLAACGGGHDDDTPPATSQVPSSASESVGGLIDYMKRLMASAAETLEPVDVSAVAPPADDAAEPGVVD